MIRIPVSRVAGGGDIDTVLQSYFAFDQFVEWTINGDFVEINLVPPPTADFYIDPQLAVGLAWWPGSSDLTLVPTQRLTLDGCSVFLNDAWTLLSWSQWLARAGSPSSITILHADDHQDLMSPRLFRHANQITDAITGESFDVRNPSNVAAAITSGAIGMGSFLVPLLGTVNSVDLRHLKARCPSTVKRAIRLNDAADTLLSPDALRLACALVDDAGPHQYTLTADATVWAQSPSDDPILLHIDLDYFNNRFDGDSNWEHNEGRHDPPLATVLDMVDELCDSLERCSDRIVDIAIGISPAFFPGEMWQPTIERILDRLGQPETGGP